jgi:hypothetical protein
MIIPKLRINISNVSLHRTQGNNSFLSLTSFRERARRLLTSEKWGYVAEQMNKMYTGSVSIKNKTTYHESEDFINGVQFGHKMEIHKSIAHG